MLCALTVCAAVQLSILLSLIDIAAGMSYLHSIGLLHSDLKGGNVLLKSCAPNKSDPRGFACKVPHSELPPSSHHGSGTSSCMTQCAPGECRDSCTPQEWRCCWAEWLAA